MEVKDRYLIILIIIIIIIIIINFIIIVIRNSSRYDIPSIGEAECTIPWNVFLSSSSSSSPGSFVYNHCLMYPSPSPGTIDNRVKIIVKSIPTSFDMDRLKYPDTQHFKGVGVVVCTLKSLSTTVGGLEESIAITGASGTSMAKYWPCYSNDDFKVFAPTRQFLSEYSTGYYGSIPIVEGDSTIRIEVSASSKVSYQFNFNVSDALPKYDTVNDTIEAQTIIRTTGGDGGKKPYKLILEAVFVPYVKGRIQIDFGPILFHPVVAPKYTKGQQGVVRASVGTSNYGFTSPFELSPNNDSNTNTNMNDKKKSTTNTDKNTSVIKKAQSAIDLLQRYYFYHIITIVLPSTSL